MAKKKNKEKVETVKEDINILERYNEIISAVKEKTKGIKCGNLALGVNLAKIISDVEKRDIETVTDLFGIPVCINETDPNAITYVSTICEFD